MRSYIQKESFLGFFRKTTIIVNALFFTKMSGNGSCRIHAQRYEETGKKQKEMGFIFIFIADKQDLKKLFSYS